MPVAVNHWVAGSSPARGANKKLSGPETWVTFCTGDMGNSGTDFGAYLRFALLPFARALQAGFHRNHMGRGGRIGLFFKSARVSARTMLSRLLQRQGVSPMLPYSDQAN